MQLNGKTALVTGSTSGIGLAAAEQLAKAGAHIILNGFADSALLADIQGKIAAHGVRVGYHAADLTKPAEIAAMMEYAEQDFAGVDILINNAGMQFVAPIQEFPTEKWDMIIALNLSAAFHTTRLAIPQMQRKGWGRIINIASVHGLVASVNKSAYVAAKHGIVGLTKAVALELAETPITCNAICPGWVLTPLIQKQIDNVAKRDGVDNATAQHILLSEKQPSKDFASSEDIAGLMLFLCSDAARQMRGSALTLDGGWTAQ